MTIGTPAGVRVLVVDDHPDHRFLAQRRLERAGFDVHLAANAEEALVEVASVDLVILDHRLPGTSGIDLLPRLVKLPQSQTGIAVRGRIGKIDPVHQHLNRVTRGAEIHQLAADPGTLPHPQTFIADTLPEESAATLREAIARAA